MIYFSDVDVVSKLAACGFLPWLPDLLGVSEDRIRIQYLASLRSRLSRPSKKLANERFQKHLEAFCENHTIIEVASNDSRQEELLNSGMDVGEAILFAEAEATGGIVVTGDKRALIAYSKVSTAAQRAKLKVVCWEQLLLRVNDLRGYAALKEGCCEGIHSDKLLLIAFSSGLATQEAHAVAALESFLRGVKEHSGDILVSFESEP
ncbi:MAG: hypothetical protein CFE44_20640 [Burkholderiales bacterium PBB4]|nr:MAG: hypothetical protein CFE44_20640 [Burkholderiales bacterium PBB4]